MLDQIPKAPAGDLRLADPADTAHLPRPRTRRLRVAALGGLLTVALLTGCTTSEGADPGQTNAPTASTTPSMTPTPSPAAPASASPTPEETPTVPDAPVATGGAPDPAETAYVVPEGWVDVSDASTAAVAMYDADPSNGAMVVLSVEQNPAARADLSTELGTLFDSDKSYDNLELSLPALTTRDGSTSSQGLTYTETNADGTSLYGAMYLLDGWLIKIAGADGDAPAEDLILSGAHGGDIQEIITSLDLERL